MRYAQLVYDGLWFSTLREALAAFVDETEKEVTGEVRIRLYKGVADATGRRSDSSLYRQDLATFGEGMAYDHADAGRLHPPLRAAGAGAGHDPRQGDGGREGGGHHPARRQARGRQEVTTRRHRAPGLPGGGGQGRHQGGRPRPGARGGGRDLRGGRGLHHEPDGGAPGGGGPRAPRLRPRPRRGRQLRLRQRGHRPRRASPTRGRWRSSPPGPSAVAPEDGGRGVHRGDRSPPAHGPGAGGHRRRPPGSSRRDHGADAARAIMTTDTKPKEASVELAVGGRHLHRGRHGQGRGHDRPEHGHDAGLLHHRRHRRSPAAAPGAGLGGGREPQPHHRGRRHVHQRLRRRPGQRRRRRPGDRDRGTGLRGLPRRA